MDQLREKRQYRKASPVVGERHGKLTIIDPDAGAVGDMRLVRVRCDCGSEKVMRLGNLRSRRNGSCGCGRAKHGHNKSAERSAVYTAWRNMIARTKPDYPQHADYFDRGIRVCDQWRGDFQAFLDHVGDRPSPNHTLDRKDNDVGYQPGNVQWVTRVRQQRNQARTRMIEWNGVSTPLIDACEAAGLSLACVRYRLRNGWPVDRALGTPPSNASAGAVSSGR